MLQRSNAMKSVKIGAKPVCLADNIHIISSIDGSLINEQMFNHCREWKEHILWYRSEILIKVKKD